MSQTWEIGDAIPLTWSLSIDGAPVDADVSLTLTLPDGTTTEPAVANPDPGSYTSGFTATQAGTYRARWVASGNVTAADTTTFLVAGYAPSPEDVHAHLPQRAAFTSTSKPSIANVENLISQAATSLAAEFPAMPTALYPIARSYLAFRVAAQVEWSYDPEQQFNGDNSQAAHLDQMAGAELSRLKRLYADDDADATRGFTIGATATPYFVQNGLLA